MAQEPLIQTGGPLSGGPGVMGSAGNIRSALLEGGRLAGQTDIRMVGRSPSLLDDTVTPLSAQELDAIVNLRERSPGLSLGKIMDDIELGRIDKKIGEEAMQVGQYPLPKVSGRELLKLKGMRGEMRKGAPRISMEESALRELGPGTSLQKLLRESDVRAHPEGGRMPWREFTSKLRESEVRAGIQRETGGQADAPSFLKKLPRGKEGPQRGEGTRGTLRWEKGPEGELELTVEPTRFTPTYEELIQKPRRSLSEELQEIVGREHARTGKYIEEKIPPKQPKRSWKEVVQQSTPQEVVTENKGRMREIIKGRNIRKNPPTAAELMTFAPSEQEVFGRVSRKVWDPDLMRLRSEYEDVPYEDAVQRVISSGGQLRGTSEYIPPVDILSAKDNSYTRRIYRPVSPSVERLKNQIAGVASDIKKTRKESVESMSAREQRLLKLHESITKGRVKDLQGADTDELLRESRDLDKMFTKVLRGMRTARGKQWEELKLQSPGGKRMKGSAQDYFVLSAQRFLENPERYAKVRPIEARLLQQAFEEYAEMTGRRLLK